MTRWVGPRLRFNPIHARQYLTNKNPKNLAYHILRGLRLRSTAIFMYMHRLFTRTSERQKQSHNTYQKQRSGTTTLIRTDFLETGTAACSLENSILSSSRPLALLLSSMPRLELFYHPKTLLSQTALLALSNRSTINAEPSPEVPLSTLLSRK